MYLYIDINIYILLKYTIIFSKFFYYSAQVVILVCINRDKKDQKNPSLKSNLIKILISFNHKEAINCDLDMYI